MAVKKEIKKVRQKRMKGEERRAQILEVATREFSRMGFEQTSMSDIADACGITKPVLYIHFKSKDELFTAAMEDRVDALSQSIQAAAPEPDPRERMLVMSTATMQALYDVHGLWPETERGGDDHPLLDRFRDGRIEMEKEIDKLMIELLPKGASGPRAEALAKMLAALTGGAGQGVRRWYAESDYPFEQDEIVRLARLMVDKLMDLVVDVMNDEFGDTAD